MTGKVKKTSEAFERKALARWRLLASQGVPVARAAVEIGVEADDLEAWIRGSASPAPLFVPVQVEEEVAGRGGLVVVLGCGVRVEGLSIVDVAELARRLS